MQSIIIRVTLIIEKGSKPHIGSNLSAKSTVIRAMNQLVGPSADHYPYYNSTVIIFQHMIGL